MSIVNIFYGDGNKVEFQYTPLRQLALIKDWLGEIRVERNSYGERELKARMNNSEMMGSRESK